MTSSSIVDRLPISFWLLLALIGGGRPPAVFVSVASLKQTRLEAERTETRAAGPGRPRNHRYQNWVAVKEPELSSHTLETILATIHRYYGNLSYVP